LESPVHFDLTRITIHYEASLDQPDKPWSGVPWDQ
jgi:hypothetical protein